MNYKQIYILRRPQYVTRLQINIFSGDHYFQTNEAFGENEVKCAVPREMPRSPLFYQLSLENFRVLPHTNSRLASQVIPRRIGSGDLLPCSSEPATVLCFEPHESSHVLKQFVP
jgi:hypothetical protein